MGYIINTIILLFLASNISGQNLILRTEELRGSKERPKIALALSGGGAHGLAHVGVIKYLEEKNIPIDIVTGTSMGAVVGALYALGYTTDEMDEIVSKYNWDDIITNRINLRELEPYEKHFHEKIPFTLRVDKNRLLLPKAIFEGYKLDQKVVEIFSPAFLIDDFSELPRPFRCYSVDILSGQVVEHKSGNLAQAVRASMAIPAIFAPVEKDSMLLIDGGLLKNFPVMEARAMGADIVIGSYVGSNRNKMDDVKSMADILKLTGFLTSLNDSERQKNQCDLLIEPKVKDYPILDFGFYEKFKQIGYDEAKAKTKEIDLFKAFIDLYKRSDPIPPYILPSRIFVEDIKVERKYNVYDEIVLNSFSDLEHKAIDLNTFNKAIERAFATGDLENLSVELREGKLGQVLELDYKVKKENSVGLTINHFANTNSSLIVSGEVRNLIMPMTTARGFIRLSENPGISGQVYKRFGRYKKILFGVNGVINRVNDPVFINHVLVKQTLINHYKIGISMIYAPLRTSAFELSYHFYNRNLRPDKISRLDVSNYRQSLNNLSISYQYNSLDQWAYPNSGKLLKSVFSLLHNVNHDVSYTSRDAENIFGIPPVQNNIKIQFTGNFYWPLGRNLVAENIISTGIYLRESLVDYFRVGGSYTYTQDMLPMIGAEQGENRLQQYFYLRQNFRFQLADKLYLSLVGNFLRGLTYNNVYLDARANKKWYTLWTGGVSLGLNSLIGPINLDFGLRDALGVIGFSVGVGYRHIF